jgi:hypothetical protein
MRCADKVVSYKFPRKGDTGNTRLIYQFDGTSNHTGVAVSDATGRHDLHLGEQRLDRVRERSIVLICDQQGCASAFENSRTGSGTWCARGQIELSAYVSPAS